MSEYQEEEAKNETVFRDMNGWTLEADDERGGLDRAMDLYLYECSDPLCTEPMGLTRHETEAIREEVNAHARHVYRDPRDHRSDLGRPDHRLPGSASVSCRPTVWCT